MKRPQTSNAGPGKTASASSVGEEVDPSAQTGTFAGDEVDAAARTGTFASEAVERAAREIVEDADHEAVSHVVGSFSGEQSHTGHRVTGIETTFSDLPSPNVETTVSDLPSSDTSFADVHVTGIETTFSDLPIPRRETTVSGVHRAPVVPPTTPGVEVTSSFSEDVADQLQEAAGRSGRAPLIAGLAVALFAGVAWLGLGRDEPAVEPAVAAEVDAKSAATVGDEEPEAARQVAASTQPEAPDVPSEPVGEEPLEQAPAAEAVAEPAEQASADEPATPPQAPVQEVASTQAAPVAMQRTSTSSRSATGGADYSLWFPFNSVSVDDPAGVVSLAARCPGALSVVGHTCDLGDEEANLWISQQRAQAVAEALQAQGASVAEVSWVGSEQPAAERSGFTVRQASRRVEIFCD